MTTSLVWPRTTLVPGAVAINGRPNNTSGGVGLGGSEQVIGNTPGRWVITFANIDVRTAEQVLAWRTVRNRARGQLTPILLPIYDTQRAPASSTTATTNASVAAGDVSIQIDSDQVLVPGTLFEHVVGEKLYEIGSVDSVVGSIYTCTIWPPIRQPIGSGIALEFDAPKIRVILATDNEMDLTLDLLKFGSGTVNFKEDV